MQGILLVDKPKSWTSFDVVNYVRRIVATANGTKPKNTKVGHTGTLDPLATGLLVLLVGKDYTRRAGELTKLDKTYEVTMKLGEVSSTGDAEGEITPYHPSGSPQLPRRPEFNSGPPTEKELQYKDDASLSASGRSIAPLEDDKVANKDKTVFMDTIPTEKAVLEALQKLQGQIMQVPPAYSAMKINGQRAYKLAREGKTVELEARPVTIYSSVLTSYEYPFVKLTSRVSSGTYIRSLVVDLGDILGTGAYMSNLRRTSIASFQLADAVALTGLTASAIEQAIRTQIV